MSPGLTNAILQDRAAMLSCVRSFFKERSVLEVDCGALVNHPPLDSHIDVLSLDVGCSRTAYLHTSPEYAMKKLLAQGSGDIFYLGHVFRKGEFGRLHHPEFTMIEWYRIGMEYNALIQETCELLFLFLGKLPVHTLTYRDAFLLHAGFDPFHTESVAPHALRLGIEAPLESVTWDRDTWLHLIASHIVEPQLGQNELTVLCEYPPSQAALSQLTYSKGVTVAKRFEIYHKGVELSNGYHELTDPVELQSRFEEENHLRIAQGKEPYTFDSTLIASFEAGLPDCCGVSVGFDRLMLLKQHKNSLSEVLPFVLMW